MKFNINMKFLIVLIGIFSGALSYAQMSEIYNIKKQSEEAAIKSVKLTQVYNSRNKNGEIFLLKT